ncbi:MAG: hypothetical protein KW802_04060 [Candidatus Doudnabacteria bacterium]|nr:hypothetical protein [Candidatus Doudnabacteria bacterium]
MNAIVIVSNAPNEEFESELKKLVERYSGRVDMDRNWIRSSELAPTAIHRLEALASTGIWMLRKQFLQ